MPRLALICLPVLAALALGVGSFAARPAARDEPVAGARAETLRPWPLEVPVRPRPRRASLGERAARLAPTWIGVPYRYGGTTPAGFDCSGFTRFVYGKLGVELPHNAAAQYDVGTPVRLSQLEPGDLVFSEGLGHVGLYLGRGRLIHAPQSGRRVEIVRLAGHDGGGLVGARRLDDA